MCVYIYLYSKNYIKIFLIFKNDLVTLLHSEKLMWNVWQGSTKNQVNNY